MSVKVSVVIPVYNARKYLHQCLYSLIAQSLKEIEIICVDDGSADKSFDILTRYGDLDSRIKIIHQENAGAAVARNKGFAIASGDYILFLDADDFFEPDMLINIYESAVQTSADIVLFGAKSYNDVTKKKENMPWMLKLSYLPKQVPFSAESIADNIFQITSPAPWNKLIRREFLEQLNIKFQSLHYSNDLSFSLTCLALAKKITYVNRSLVNYRRGLKTNAQSHKNEYPYDFFLAIQCLKENLIAHGAFDVFKSSFLKMAEENCAFNFSDIHYNVLSKEERINICQKLEVPYSAWNRKEGKCESADPKSPFYVSEQISTHTHDGNCFNTGSVLLSVVIPVYNTECFLSHCLDSIVGQSYDRLEIICVDDGSTDSSIDILRSYAEKDSRIRLIEKARNEGLLLARKSGALAATGDYLIFVDSDDYLELNACKELIALTTNYQADIFHYTVGVEDYSGDKEAEKWLTNYLTAKDTFLSGNEIMQQLFITRSIPTSLVGKLFKVELCKKVFAHIPDYNCYLGEDLFTSFLFGFYAGNYIGIKTKPLYWYRRGLGVSNNQIMSLPKFESYCKMAELVKYAYAFLASSDCLDTYEVYAEAMATRMFEDCCRIYQYRLSRTDKFNGGQILIQYWGFFEKADVVFQKIIGQSAEEFEHKHQNIPETIKFCRKDMARFAPKVSIIIPVYNVQDYLRACLDSAVGQTLKDIEIICVNDGSWDASTAILEEAYSRDDRICLISGRNEGQSSARNKGIKYAHGEYILFLDSDDLILSQTAEALYNRATEQQLDILFFEGETLFESADIKKDFSHYEDTYHRWHSYNGVASGIELLCELVKNGDYKVTPCQQLVRREHLTSNNISFLYGILYEDNLFTFQNILLASRVGVSGDAYYIRRLRANSIVTKPRGFENMYGYLMCYYHMMLFVSTRHFSVQQEQYIKEIIDGMRRSVDSINRRLAPIERKKVQLLSPIESLWYTATIHEIKYVEKEKIVEKKIEVEVKSKVDETALIRSSYSYRIGRFITFIPRKIRGCIRCFKEHGTVYTFNRILVHLRLKSDSGRKSLPRLVRGGIRCLKEHGLRYTLKNIHGKMRRRITN